MATLSRKFCKALGLTDEQTESIIEAHTEVTDKLKAENDSLKATNGDVEKLKSDFAAAKEQLKDYDKIKAENEKRKADFDNFKSTVEAERKKAAQNTSYKKWLMNLGHSSESADKIIRIDSRRPKFNDENQVDDSDGAFAKEIDADWHVEPNKTWSEGAKTQTPPANNGTGASISRARQLAQEYHNAKYGTNNKEE